MEWKNKWETRFIYGQGGIRPILNEADENGYDVFDIQHRQTDSRNFISVTTGTLIIFKRKPEVNEPKESVSFDDVVKMMAAVIDGLYKDCDNVHCCDGKVGIMELGKPLRTEDCPECKGTNRKLYCL